jgi:hypothetical protein
MRAFFTFLFVREVILQNGRIWWRKSSNLKRFPLYVTVKTADNELAKKRRNVSS